jgi:tripartite-type tricarboxylate transporter receptor subunit TctC
MQPARSALVVVLAVAVLTPPAAAQDYYAGKTLRIIVGVEAGGTVDTMARLFVTHLRRHVRAIQRS